MDDIARLSDRIFVLKNGKVSLSGTPNEVFSDVNRLRELGLKPTQCSDVLLQIKQKGFDIDICNFTPERAADEIYRALKL
jgi:energy-coupling factor transport system ATP-binding protein